MKKIFIIDGSSFLYRAYYALKPMHTPQGVPVGAVYGFCRMLKKLMTTHVPENIIIAWDSKGETERHQLLASYKETRLASPTDLHTQKEVIQQIAEAIGICQVSKQGVEADDIMYSIGKDFSEQNFSVTLVTSDKDMGQMVTDTIIIYDTFKDAFFDAQALETKYGFPPTKLPFYFALVGDASDNIPGVAGIGPKGATELVQQFANLADMYGRLDEIKKERTRALLLANKNNAFLSEKLFLLRYSSFGITPEMCQLDLKSWDKAQDIFKSLNFKSLLNDTPAKVEQTPFLSTAHGFIFSSITEDADIAALCAAIKKVGHCGVDTETDSTDAYAAGLVGMSFAYEVGKAVYIPVAHTTTNNAMRDVIMKHIKPLLEDASVKKYLHNSKFDELVFARYGITMTGVTFDTIIATHLVAPDWQKLNLKAVSSAYLGQEMLTYKEVMQRGKFKTFADVPLDLAVEYGASDAHQVLQLVPLLQKKLIEQHAEEIFTAIEMPLEHTLVAMEKEGINVDTELLARLSDAVGKVIERIREDIITLIGPEYTDVNLNAPRQIEEILFTKLQLQPLKKTSKKTGYSTDHEVLAELALHHPVPELILKYRELHKLKSTYLDALPTYVNKYTGRIHTSFNQTGTATGRLASSDPNLQNVPATTIGTTSPAEGMSIRSAFKAPEGNLFISADYSQIELRVLAHLSKDQALVDAFLHNQDIHARTAAGLFELPLEEVSQQQRQLGKRINFSILYGLTPYGLSKDLGISYGDAQKYIDRYFANYPGVSAWIEKVIEETKEHGYVTTEWGRKRYVPGIYEKNRTLYELACRIAVNTKAQGTAAEIMKIGMNRLHEQFLNNKNNEKIILQIHDELLITAPTEIVAQTEQTVVKILQDVVAWNIPLIVTTRHGNDWHEVSK